LGKNISERAIITIEGFFVMRFPYHLTTMRKREP